MAIGDDWGIDFINKRIYHKGSGTTVYTVNELYSWLQDQFDELTAMDDEVPMSAQTPTAYTMINGWFLDEGQSDTTNPHYSHKYLKEGSIATSGYENVILILDLTSYTSCVTSDIGKTVTEVGFDNTLAKWWIRDTNSHGQIANGSTMAISGGTGAGVADGNSATGENLYSNVYTLGTIESSPAPQVYIFQAGSALSEWSNVLIKVKEAGSLIDNGNVTVYARQGGDLFDHFTIDLSSGGRNAVPLATANDINQTKGDYYLLYDNGSTTAFSVAEIIKDDAGDWEAEVVSLTTYSASEGLLELIGFKGTLADGDSFTGQTSGATADANGTLGDTIISWDAGTDPTTLGQILTGTPSQAKRILRGVDGTNNKAVCQVSSTATGSARTAYYKDFLDNDTVTGDSDGNVTLDSDSTTIVSGYTDITIAFVNGTASYSGTSGTFTLNERVTYTGGEAIILAKSGTTTGTITFGNVTNTSLNGKTITGDISGATADMTSDLSVSHTTDKAFQKQTAYPYDVIVDCGSIYNTGRALSDVYQYFKFVTQENSTFSMYTVSDSTITVLDGEEYIQAYSGYTPVKASPLGTFAGGVFFGAQGVWIEHMASSDVENFQLIDSNGSTRTPPTQATITVSSLQSGDRVGVFITPTLGGDINKSQYTLGAGNNAGNTSIVVSSSIELDTPSSGKIRAVDVDATENKEQRYRYSSWSGSTFTLVTGASGSATSDTQTGVLIDTSADFGGTDDVEVGDVIRNTTDGSSGYVVSVDSSTQLTTVLYGGSNNYWSNGDNYDTNKLDRNYASGTDTAYVPLIDEEATGTSVEETVLYSADRYVMVRVRKKGILPFETSGTFTQAGLNVSAIRTTDSIVS